MEQGNSEDNVLIFEYDLYLDYEGLFNLKIFKDSKGVWFDITYEGFFHNVPESLQAKVNDLFDRIESKGHLRELPLAIYKLIVPSRYTPDKIFIFKTYDWVNQKTGITIK